MGLSNFQSPCEGVLPLLVMNTVMSVALVKNKLRSVFLGGAGAGDQEFEDEYSGEGSREGRVTITRYSLLCKNRCGFINSRGGGGNGRDWPAAAVECCVCLCGFEGDEEVSELSCKHFFHKGCLDKWFDNQHLTCPLCRSIL